MTMNDTESRISPLTATNVALAAVCNILFTNDVVCGLVVDFIGKLKESAHYRFNVKKQAGRIEREMRKYEKLVAEIAGKKIFFIADANEVIAEELQPDLLKMEYSIKSEFDRHKLKDSSLLAKMELTRCMAELSCLSLDKRIEEVAPYYKNVVKLTYLRLTTLFKLIDRLSDALYQGKEYIDLNQSPNCRLAMQIIQRKLTDCNIISRAIREADELNAAV